MVLSNNIGRFFSSLWCSKECTMFFGSTLYVVDLQQFYSHELCVIALPEEVCR